jgi:hypothetical protein
VLELGLELEALLEQLELELELGLGLEALLEQ